MQGTGLLESRDRAAKRLLEGKLERLSDEIWLPIISQGIKIRTRRTGDIRRNHWKGHHQQGHELKIRVANISDTATIARFNAAMALESEDIELDYTVVAAGVRAAIEDPNRAFYLLSEVDGAPAGQLMVTFEWSDWRDGWIWWIQSVYVEPDHRRQGVYRGLYRRLEELAAEANNVRGIRLYVMRENVTAKKTYESLGMRHSEYDLYETEFGP